MLYCLAINDAEPWFGENIARSQYIALLQQEEPEATETQLTAALLRRAMEGVVRVLSMREDKQVLANLVKQGTVGDDIWTQFTLSEKELEAEIMAIVEEANTFKENWGQSILQTASEMVKILDVVENPNPCTPLTLSCVFFFLKRQAALTSCV